MRPSALVNRDSRPGDTDDNPITPPTPTLGRTISLDGLRGLAALSVALGHCILVAGGLGLWQTGIRDFPAMSGLEIALRVLSAAFPSDAAVMVFFVLSGHVLWLSFARKNLFFVSGLANYISARVYRLFPLAIVSALPIGLLSAAPAHELVLNMLLLSNSLNGVLWSLQVEVVASLALFAVWGLTRGTPVRLVVALTVALAATPFFRGNPYVVFFPAFLLGAGIISVPAAIWRWRLLPAAAIAILLSANLAFGHGGMTRAFEMIGATVLVGVTAHGRLGFLSGRVPVFLGAISYPLYLIHPACLDQAVRWWGAAPSVSALPVLVVTSLVLAIPTAWLLHRYVEDPILRARP